MDNSSFVETRAAKHVFECIQENSCVTITGSSGVGKISTLQNVVSKMADEGYSILLVTNPHDIVKFYNPNKKTLFVMDDFCGTYSINQSDLESLESVMKRIKELIKNKMTKIIVACRLQIYQDNKFELLSFFKTCVCNLLSEDLCLSQTEKQSIAELYLETSASDIIQYCDLFPFFPLLCKLYSDNPGLDITNFFQNPFSVYKDEIDKLHKKGHFGKYCALALCVIFNNRLEEE
ncbi:ZYG11 [Mytilus coruscus]|uniref:ZYG11 n=1 Tax=Mytilus coruscus TaxID=42192 RepID=A0A6J8B6U9_MYTCO|nr:ZYG11 [Mytilus coruscus]